MLSNAKRIDRVTNGKSQMTFVVGQQNNSQVKVDIGITVEGFTRFLYDKREVKAAMRKGGYQVRGEARRLIAKRAISGAGEFPGLDSGAMRRSIRVKVSGGGGYVKVMPYKTAEMGKDFYPAYLYYGTKNGLKPRKNFMTAALDNKQAAIRSRISAALQKALQTA